MGPSPQRGEDLAPSILSAMRTPSLPVILLLASCAAPAGRGGGLAGLQVSPLPRDGPLAILGDVFDRHVGVFGVQVVASPEVTERKLLHAAAVLAEYIDNDCDGLPDDPAVAATLQREGALLVMFPEEGVELGSLDWGALEEAGFHAVQDLRLEETLPDGPPHRRVAGRFDATLEEVWHLVGRGWELTYPDAFGTRPGTRLTDAMDLARGGRFLELPRSYPEEGWYHYDDRTCDYECMAAEYFYWCLTSLLGGQDYPGRAEEIHHEWELATQDAFAEGDKAALELLTDPAYRLPTRLPDGRYTSGALRLPGAGEQPRAPRAGAGAARGPRGR